MNTSHDVVAYRPERVVPDETLRRLRADYEVAQARRTVRMFSSAPVPREAIEEAIRIAGTAPSGAHRQPWHFVAIPDADRKAALRVRVEQAEQEFYSTRIPDDWRQALAPLGTDAIKPHLTDAPWVLVVFREDYSFDANGDRQKNYYMTESVGIAVGFLIQALHRAGLATLTHTPAPMTFLRELCQRPENEKPFLLMPVGYPAEDATVPNLTRKPLSSISTFL